MQFVAFFVRICVNIPCIPTTSQKSKTCFYHVASLLKFKSENDMLSGYHVWSDQVLRWLFSFYICKCWPMPWFVKKNGHFGTTLFVIVLFYRGGSASAIALKWWIVFGLMTSWIGKKIWRIWSSPTSTTQSSGYPTIEKKNTNTRRLFPLTFPHFASFLDVTFDGDCSFRARLASINEETAVDTPCLVQDGWRLGSLDGQFRSPSVAPK